MFSTSPSVYLEVVGTASVKDQCGPIGGVITNPVIAIPPGQLSTYVPQMNLLPSGSNGITYTDLQGVAGGGVFLGTVKPLNVAELACPSFGIGIGTSANGDTFTTVGPPYLPIIVPPSQAFDLDPQWKRFCTGLLSNADGLASFAIFDPPRALKPVGQIAPDPVAPSEPTPTRKPDSDPSIVPAPAPALPTPKPTNSTPAPPSQDSPFQDPPSQEPPSQDPPSQDPPSQDPPPAIDPSGPGDQPTQGGSPAQGGSQAQGNSPTEDDPVDPGADNGNSPVNQPANGNPGSAGPGPGEPNNPQQTSQGLGGMIMGGLNGGSPQGPAIPEGETVAAPITIGGQILTTGSFGLKIAGETAAPGGAPITIAGTPISLDSSGTIYINGHPAPLSPNNQIPPPSVFTVADEVFTANPTGFSIAGSNLSPGQAPVTIAGTPVALGSSRNLVIGSSTVDLEPTLPLSVQVFTVGDQPFTANPTGISIAGSSLLPGQAPVTISGTQVALDPLGNLLIGSSTVDIINFTIACANLHRG